MKREVMYLKFQEGKGFPAKDNNLLQELSSFLKQTSKLSIEYLFYKLAYAIGFP